MRLISGCLALLGLLFTHALFAQDQTPGLPRWLTEEEEIALPFYSPPATQGWSAPLSGLRGETLRTMAEWEELQAVVITWTSFQAILAEIVRAIQPECQVIIVCSNETTVKNYLSGKGIDWTQNITFIQGPFNSIWVRDFGPNTVYAGDVDSLILVDWIYNRPRPSDDLVPFLVGNTLQLPVVSTSEAPHDLVHTGGNFMSDGMGTGFSSRLVLDENGPGNKFGKSIHDEAAVDGIMSLFMGIDPYIKMTNLPFDGIHHIDMHMKLLDEETLLVGQYPMGIADGPQIEANLQYVLSQFNSRFGTPYKVIRMPMPPDATGKYPHQGGHYRTYTNSLVANKTIIVPTYDEQYDTTALRIYREAKPGYHVVGINCNSIIPSGGALHCITKEIGVQGPLRIVHQPVSQVQEPQAEVEIRALIQHRQGIQEAWVYYTSDTLTGYTPITMEPVGADDEWVGYIPAPDTDARIFYYIEALATDGKLQRRPMTAPQGYWRFDIPGQPTSQDLPSTGGIQVGAVFPNPASAITCIPVQLGDYQGHLEVALLDMLGRVHPLFSGQVSGGERPFFFNAAQWVSGPYSLRITTEQHQYTQTVIIRP